MVCSSQNCQRWAHLCSLLASAMVKACLFFFLLSLWRANAKCEKDHKRLVKASFSTLNTEVLNGQVTCQRSNNFIYVEVRPGPIQNNGTLPDKLLCQVSFEALTPYPTSPSEQLSKVLLSSSFHRWRNWDSETLSNMLGVSQQTVVRGRARVFNPLLLVAVTPAAATRPPLHFPLHTVPWCSREEAVSFECMYFLSLEANTRLSTIACDSSWLGFSPLRNTHTTRLAYPV